MARTTTPNVTLNIYRGFNAGSPYPVEGTLADVVNVEGLLKSAMTVGRLGNQAPKLRWTHLLVLDPGVDVRSAYNSWTGAAEPTQNADTVLLKDYPQVGQCTAFYVVLVQPGRQPGGNACLNVYLDRLQPRIGSCFVPGVSENCGNCSLLPAAWKVTVGNDFINNGCGNCASLNGGTWNLNHVSGCVWTSDTFAALCSSGTPAGPVNWHFSFLTGFGWRLSLDNALISVLVFDLIAAADFRCTGPNTFVNPSWEPGTCASTSSVTLNRM